MSDRYYMSGPFVFHADHVDKPEHFTPVVVIPPEDREQVERLAMLCRYGLDPDAMQAALREFANPQPVKPPEPTGLGAVVLDNRGKRWTRVKDGFAWRWRDDHLGEQTAWEHIVGRVVEVLSDGYEVTP